MIDTTLLTTLTAFVVVLFTILWADRRHDKRADRHDERLSAIEIDVAGIKVELNRLNERADRQDERLNAMAVDITGVKSEMVRLNERVDRQDERADRQDERADRQDERADRQDERADRQDGHFDEMQHGINVLGSKIDRAQGNLDVLVFGERGVPPPVLRERSELESRAEEAVGDD